MVSAGVTQHAPADNADGWFEYNDCGYPIDGDYNMVTGIGFKLLTVPSGKRPDGLGDGHLAFNSGTLNGTGECTASSTSEADQKSTDKLTTSVVDR